MDAIISLASMTHVAWSNSHELRHTDEFFVFKTPLKFETTIYQWVCIINGTFNKLCVLYLIMYNYDAILVHC